MISGAELRRAARFSLFFLLVAGPAAAQGWGLPALMASLAQVRAETASFSNREVSPLLSAPLISTGTLDYAAPDYLRKRTIQPVSEDFVLDHGEVTLSGSADGGTHIFRLAQDERIAGLVEGIRGTLAGDLPGLNRYYVVSLSGGPAAWQLRLLPRGKSLQRFLRQMLISGGGNRVSTIDTLSADGSDARMSIDAATVQHVP